MESLKELLSKKEIVSKRPTTRLWELAEQCALATKTNPKRWLRACKDEFSVKRALIDLKEWSPNEPYPAFCWLLKKYQHK